MRVLFLSHRLPYPPHKGEKIRALNVLKFLARRHEIYLGCLIDDPRDLPHVAHLSSYVHGLIFERIHPGLRRALALPAVLGSRSITVTCFYSRRLQRRLDDLIERERIEAVFCSSSPMAEYLFRSRHSERLRSVTRVMDLIDVDSFKWAQYARESPPWSAWIYRHEARHLAAFEQRIAREFDHVLVVSEQEKRYFPVGTCPAKLSAVLNGVDLQFFSPDYSGRATRPGPTLVFTGAMDYRPNVDGIRWFVDRVLPRVQSAVPDVQLYVVGNRPTKDVRRLGRRAGVVVTGFVEDVRDYLAGASVCIAPLRIARGIQNKILEAMAMGRAVIATRAAFEGISAEPQRDLVVADGEGEFAAAAVALLRDRQRAEQIGRNARVCVERRHSWGENLRLLQELFPASDAGPSSAAAHPGALTLAPVGSALGGA